MSANEVRAMLGRAGLDAEVIDQAVDYIVKGDGLGHQREIADNDFLPPLRKSDRSNVFNVAAESDSDKRELTGSEEFIESDVARVVKREMHRQSLFTGRLRRKDFIIGILFFFGMGFVLASVALTWLQFLTPSFVAEMSGLIAMDAYGIWLLCIPFIFAPLTVMILSLLVRRLHNLGLPGWIAFLYLFAFLSPFGKFSSAPLWVMHGILLMLFIVMLCVKGRPAPNKHGMHPESHGSIFKRILGQN